MTHDNSAGRIIFLNGTSSSGKSTLAKRLQATLADPYLHIEVDQFLGTLPEQCRDWSKPENARAVYKLVSGMHRCVGTLAAAGNNLIVDTVLASDDNLAECVFVLAHLQVTFVGVYCDIAEAERRESKRPDRKAGLARAQAAHVHAYGLYDLKVDTSKESPEQAAARIVEFHQATPWPQAFRQIRNELISIKPQDS